MKNSSNEPSGSQSLLKSDYFLNKVSGKYVAASVFSMIFLYAGSLIDTLLVGFLIGENGLAAMSLVSPVYLMYYTVGATVGIGGSVVASRMIGKGDDADYRRIFTCSTVILSAAFIILTVAGYAFLDPISDLLAGNSGNNTLVRDYMKFYIPGGGFNLLAYVPLYFLKIDGRPKVSSILFFVSASLNVVLSWLFMSPVCGMGIGGASLATTVSLCLTAVLGYYFLMRGNKTLRFIKGSMTAKGIKSILLAGTPNGLGNLLESLRILLINSLILSIGAAVLLPCYTVVRNVSDLLGSVMIGISSAMIPLIGVFYGEHDHTNVRAVMRLAAKIGIIVMIPLIIFVCAFSDLLSGLFGVTDAVIIEANRLALPLSCFGLLAAYINTLNIGYLTAIKRELLANLLVILRLLVFLAVFALTLVRVIGINGIWLSLSLTEIASLAVYAVICLLMRKKKPSYDKYLLDTDRESEDDISFSVKNDVSDIVFSSEKISDFCDSHDIDMKKSMRVGLALEEILTVLINQCLSTDKESYIDIRVCKLSDEVMMRFRYMGKLFDPSDYYEKNKDNEEMSDELLGMKMIVNSATLIDFRQTFGTNNLLLMF